LIATQGHLFSHIGDTCCYLVCVLSFRHHSLSLRRRLGHSYFDNYTRALSLLRRSLARCVCSDVPAGLSCSPPPAARALRIPLNFSPQKAGTAVGRPATRARRQKGPERTSTAPSSALSLRPRCRLRSSSSAALAS
jgi:hypothetical protein